MPERIRSHKSDSMLSWLPPNTCFTTSADQLPMSVSQALVLVAQTEDLFARMGLRSWD